MAVRPVESEELGVVERGRQMVDGERDMAYSVVDNSNNGMDKDKLDRNSDRDIEQVGQVAWPAIGLVMVPVPMGDNGDTQGHSTLTVSVVAPLKEGVEGVMVVRTVAKGLPLAVVEEAGLDAVMVVEKKVAKTVDALAEEDGIAEEDAAAAGDVAVAEGATEEEHATAEEDGMVGVYAMSVTDEIVEAIAARMMDGRGKQDAMAKFGLERVGLGEKGKVVKGDRKYVPVVVLVVLAVVVSQGKVVKVDALLVQLVQPVLTTPRHLHQLRW